MLESIISVARYPLTWVAFIVLCPLFLLERLGVPSNVLFALSIPLLIAFGIAVSYVGYRLLRRIPRKVLLRVGAGVVTVLVLALAISYAMRYQRPRPLTFDGQSTALSRTQFVPTLDTPVEPRKNAIWCASFQAAWKTLQDGSAQGPIELEGAGDLCRRLNTCSSPEVPDRSLYAAAGRVSDGIVEKIRRELPEKFPKATCPDFGPLAPDSIVAFAHLESRCAFTIPYFDSVKPTTFTDSTGKTTQIRTFGLRSEDESAYMKLRKQLRILVKRGSVRERPDDFAVDLCKDSKDTQVVFARVPACPSLSDALAAIDADIATARRDEARYEECGVNDILLVPELAYHIQHRFTELEHRGVASGALNGAPLEAAWQDVMFRLDRSGTELMSQAAVIYLSMGGPMVGDRPFLVYLKKRGARLPYFVMWVDNAELLTVWDDQKS